MQRNKILLDTHILLWSLLTPTKLSKELQKVIEGAQNESRLYISCITLWEIAMLASKSRISIHSTLASFLRKIISQKGLHVYSIDDQVATESVVQDGLHGDPADRIIIATAKVLSARLVTSDRSIISYARGESLRVLVN